MTTRLVLLAIIAAGLIGCASMPRPLQGQYSEVAPAQAASEGRTGTAVRWGGRIISVDPTPQQTCFEILSRNLGNTARPARDADQSRGRFIACRAGFYDPAIFSTERDVTVTGTLSGFETRRIGEYDYHYPRVDADTIYLWPQETTTRVYYSDPFWSGHPGYWGGYWGYRHPIVVRHPKTAEAAPKPELTAPKK